MFWVHFMLMLLVKSARGLKHEKTKERKNEKETRRAPCYEFANSIHVDVVGEIGAGFETRKNEGKKKRKKE